MISLLEGRSNQGQKSGPFPNFYELGTLFCEIFDCKEWAFFACEA